MFYYFVCVASGSSGGENLDLNMQNAKMQDCEY